MARKLWTYWLLFVLSVGLGIGVYQFTTYRAIRSAAMGQLQHLASAKKQALQNRLEEAVRSLRQATDFVSSVKPGTFSAEKTNQFLEGLIQKNPAIITMLVIDAQGVSVASNRPTLIGSRFKNSPRYKAISQDPDKNKIYISDPFVTPLGNYTIGLGAMLANQEGGFDGYILAIASPEFFWKILYKDTATYDVASVLIHDSGLVIYRTPDSDEREASDLRAYPDSSFWNFLKSGKDADEVTAVVPKTGLMNMLAYRRIALQGIATDHQLYLGLGMETDVVFDRWLNRGLQLFAVWVLLASLGGIWVAWKIQRSET